MTEFKIMRDGEQAGEALAEREGLFLTLRCSAAYYPRVTRLYGVTPSGYIPIGIPVPVGGRLRLTKKYTGNDLKALSFDSITHFELYDADETPVMKAPENGEEQREREDGAAETAVMTPEEEPPEPAEERDTECAVTEAEETAERPVIAEDDEAHVEITEQPAGPVWRPADDPSALFDDPELKETASVIENGMTAEDGESLLFAIPVTSGTPFPLMPVFRYGWSAMVDGKFCSVFGIKDGKLV